MPNSTAASRTEAVSIPLAIVTGGMLIAALYLIFIWAPMERSMGMVQRIFYFHVPSALTAFVAFFIGGFDE